MSQVRSPSAATVAGAVARIALPSTDEDIATLRRAVIRKLTYSVGKDPIVASDHDWFVAVALSVRDRIVERWFPSTRETYAKGRKRVYYLSLEFLIGRLLFDSLNNLGLTEQMRTALSELGVDMDKLRQIEPDAALGNGGLGRLAACFMESMATIGVAAYGYGIRYNHGLFRQVIKDGWQHELPENWLSFGNPWEFERPEVQYSIGFGGNVEAVTGADGTTKHIWHPAETVDALAYDTPVVGWRGKYVNTLRLWSSRATDPLRLDAFNRGDHIGALSSRAKANAISQILYPSDETPAGQELRLRQEFFFVSASLQDLIRRHVRQHKDIRTLADKAAIQLNDTHPAIAVPELMRLLIDVHDVAWAEAWKITVATLSYTNHTLLPEALETWPVPLLERLLPRHMQIIYQINWLHLDRLREEGFTDAGLLQSVSLIDENSGRRTRMGTLAFLGSHKINGVSALHTDLMRETVFHDLNKLFPDRITNKTNGITFRRWLFEANPGLTSILVDAVGPEVLDDPAALEKLVPLAGDSALHDRMIAARRINKQALAAVIWDRVQVHVDPDALFDVQIKRIHEYKRQLLNILETIALYSSMRAQPMRQWAPRVKIFAGKAAASYHRAKLIIKLAHDVARVVNNDPTLRGQLKVVFLPNYNVSLAEVIIPAADLSEQISTAGMEASGTGNMKLALNGALTIGTLDGANVEIRDRVGAENIFIFGMTAEEVETRRRGGISSADAIAASPMLREVLDEIGSGVFSPDEPERYRELVDVLTHHDHFMVSADFDSYAAAQRTVAAKWHDRPAWWRSSVLNTARVGWFSSDRTIREYAEEIWNVQAAADG
jgi:starch phosphorylase